MDDYSDTEIQIILYLYETSGLLLQLCTSHHPVQTNKPKKKKKEINRKVAML